LKEKIITSIRTGYWFLQKSTCYKEEPAVAMDAGTARTIIKMYWNQQGLNYYL